MKKIYRIALVLSLAFASQVALSQEDSVEVRVDAVVKEIIKASTFEAKVQKVVKFNNEIRASMAQIPRESEQWAQANEFVTYLDQVEDVGNRNSCSETLRLLNALGALEQRSEFVEGKSRVTPLALQARRLLKAICLN